MFYFLVSFILPFLRVSFSFLLPFLSAFPSFFLSLGFLLLSASFPFCFSFVLSVWFSFSPYLFHSSFVFVHVFVLFPFLLLGKHWHSKGSLSGNDLVEPPFFIQGISLALITMARNWMVYGAKNAAPPRSPWKSSEWSSRRGCICASSQPTFCGRARACRAASVYWLGFSGALKDACLQDACLQDACLNLTTGNQTSKWTLPCLRLKTS